MKKYDQERQQLCKVGQRMYARGWVASNDGNISVRVSADEILCTPTGMSKGDLTPEDLCLLDMEGNLLEGTRPASSEIGMHFVCFRTQPRVGSVCHAHCPTATAFAAAGRALDQPVLTEVVATLGSIPLVPYATPGTDEVAETLLPYLAEYDAFLLANHGVVTVGKDLWEAYYRMESVEHCARIMCTVYQLGGPCILSPEQVKILHQIGGRSS